LVSTLLTLNTFSAEFQICTLMPEDGRIRSKNVACSDGFYKFVVSGGNEHITINLAQYKGMNSIKTVDANDTPPSSGQVKN